MFELLSDPQAWMALLALTSLEIVLGVDNLVFLAIVVGRLPKEQQPLARQLGLGLALATRLVLLFALSWLIGLTEPWFHVQGHAISGRDLILIAGGLFLLWKATIEMHHQMNPHEEHLLDGGRTAPGFTGTIIQIALIDMVFSLDSVITALGMAKHIEVMIAAVVIAMGVMMLSAKSIGEFVGRHPTLKVLALSFLVLIGAMLVAEGFEVHVPKGYIYFAMAYAISVELINMRIRRRVKKPAA
jgi:predicted tellurium resistance membrane protein TerC